MSGERPEARCVIPIRNGDDVQVEIVEVPLERSLVFFIDEAEIPMACISRPLTMAFKKQAKIRIIETIHTTTDIHPCGGPPKSREVVTIYLVPRNLLVRTAVENDCIGAFPIPVKVDDLIKLAVPLCTDNLVAIHPGDRHQRSGVVD